MFLVEAGRKTKVSELDMTTSVEQDVVGLDITGALSVVYSLGVLGASIPMDKAKFVHSFQSQCNLGHVETSNVFRENLVLDQHCHEITARQELHEHVKKGRVLERGMQLDEPGTVGVCKNVAFGTHVSELILLELPHECQYG